MQVAKDTGLINLPLHGSALNQLLCDIIRLANELTAGMQLLGLQVHEACQWARRRLRQRLFAILVGPWAEVPHRCGAQPPL